MKKYFSILLLTILTTILYSCNGTVQKEQTQAKNKTTSSSTVNYGELVGGYGIESHGQVQLKIITEGSNFYLQFPGSDSKELMEKISEDDYSRILGSNWQNNLISGLHSGSLFVIKVKTGSIVQGITINSGFFGAIPGAGEIWKIN